MAAKIPSRPSGPPPALRKFEVKPRRAAKELELDRFIHRAAWKKLRKAYLAENPLCELCKAEGRVVAASHVHHKVDRRVDPERALDWDNLQALDASCHSRITNERRTGNA